MNAVWPGAAVSVGARACVDNGVRVRARRSPHMWCPHVVVASATDRNTIEAIHLKAPAADGVTATIGWDHAALDEPHAAFTRASDARPRGGSHARQLRAHECWLRGA